MPSDSFDLGKRAEAEFPVAESRLAKRAWAGAELPFEQSVKFVRAEFDITNLPFGWELAWFEFFRYSAHVRLPIARSRQARAHFNRNASIQVEAFCV